jgi:hypothetical protein
MRAYNKDMNPWLQRALVSLAAGTIAGGAVVATAKNRHKKARKRRKKKDAPPVLLGTVAKRDAQVPHEGGITVEQWVAGIKDGVTSLSLRVKGYLIGSKDEGQQSARDADEVIAKDGTVTRKKKTNRAPRQNRRGRHKRREATLFESAQESFKQVIRDETKRVVQDQVDKTGLSKAQDTLKSASAAVADTAVRAKEKLSETVVPAVVDGAKKLFVSEDGKESGLQQGLNRLTRFLQGPGAPPAEPPPRKSGDDGVDAKDPSRRQ